MDLKLIEKKIMQTPGVVAVHEFHIWRLVGVKIIATVHIRFLSLDHYLKSAEHIRDIFHNHKVHSVTVQPEFTEVNPFWISNIGWGQKFLHLVCAHAHCFSFAIYDPYQKVKFTSYAKLAIRGNSERIRAALT